MKNNKVQLGMAELVALLDACNDILEGCVKLNDAFQGVTRSMQVMEPEPWEELGEVPDNVVDIRRRINKDPNEIYNNKEGGDD